MARAEFQFIMRKDLSESMGEIYFNAKNANSDISILDNNSTVCSESVATEYAVLQSRNLRKRTSTSSICSSTPLHTDEGCSSSECPCSSDFLGSSVVHISSDSNISSDSGCSNSQSFSDEQIEAEISNVSSTTSSESDDKNEIKEDLLKICFLENRNVSVSQRNETCVLDISFKDSVKSNNLEQSLSNMTCDIVMKLDQGMLDAISSNKSETSSNLHEDPKNCLLLTSHIETKSDYGKTMDIYKSSIKAIKEFEKETSSKIYSSSLDGIVQKIMNLTRVLEETLSVRGKCKDFDEMLLNFENLVKKLSEQLRSVSKKIRKRNEKLKDNEMLPCQSITRKKQRII